MNPIDKLQAIGAVWRYPGSGKHAVYTVGKKHSNFYFNSAILNAHPTVLREILESPLAALRERFPEHVEWVVSYAPYGTFVAETLAGLLNCQVSVFDPAKSEFSFSNISENARVLLVADDLYTGTSIVETRNALLRFRPTILPAILVVGNFSGDKTFRDYTIYSAFQCSIDRWNAEDCPLCAAGSLPVEARPNWPAFMENVTV